MAYNINFLSNRIFLYFDRLKNINLLDSFRFINYKGFILPRAAFSQIDDYKKTQKKSPISKESKKKEIDDNDCIDIVIPIEKDENVPENKELEFGKEQNEMSVETNDFFSQEKNDSLFTDNYKIEIDKIIEEHKDISLIPPKRIISLIIDGNDDEGQKNEKNNYEIINKILLDNMCLIKNQLNPINNVHKEISSPKNNNFPTNLNPNMNFKKNPKKMNNSPIFLNTNLNKQVFVISPENSITLTLKKKFRGRKGIKDNNGDKRIHGASDDDNVLRKIQVHFLSFVVNFTNDVIRTLIKDKNPPLFKNLDYKIKKIVKHKVIEDFKSKTIGEILQSKISPKMKTYDTNANQIIYYEICQKCLLMKEFLQTKYIDLFKEYYSNRDRKFEVSGNVVQFSSKTKSYNDLILKNYQYKEKIKYVTITYFLNSYKRRKKPNFMTYTYEK